jgi:methylmalonyl-CoA mutase N-terminal domain/subunit
MRDRVGARDPRSWQLRTHVQTSGVSLTAQQPLLNLARTAVEALGAVLAGTQSLHTNAWDETLALPTEESALLALRTQQVIADETDVARVPDPLGGSHHVEALTDRLEQEARAYLDEIAARGGMVAAVEQGYPQAEIAEAAYRHHRRMAAGERLVVGVNVHRAAEEPPVAVHRADPAAERAQADRVRALRARRDPAAHAAAVAALRAACEGGANVMPRLIDAAAADATLGEMCDVFRAVWGPYRDPARI